MVTVLEVKNLNQKIDALNLEAEKARVQHEYAIKQLMQLFTEYKETYGVDLWVDGNLDDVKSRVEKEVTKVGKKLEEDYAKGVEVTNLVENGDIAGANALLGGTTEVVTTEEVVKEEDKETTFESLTSGIEKSKAEVPDGMSTASDLLDDIDYDALFDGM